MHLKVTGLTDFHEEIQKKTGFPFERQKGKIAMRQSNAVGACPDEVTTKSERNRDQYHLNIRSPMANVTRPVVDKIAMGFTISVKPAASMNMALMESASKVRGKA